MLIESACREHIVTFSAFAQMPDASLKTDGGLVVLDTGHPVALFNGVLDTQIDDAAAVATAINQTVEAFAARNLPFLWWDRPAATPSDLGERLTAAGFQKVGSQPVMVKPLNGGPPPPQPVDGLRTTPVRTASDVDTYCNVFVAGFGLPDLMADVFRVALTSFGLTPDAPCQSFVGWLGDEPVATASVFLATDMAGVYTVSTIESARRRGIGAALTLAAEAAAIERGFEHAVLQSSDMGYRVYESLGYEEVCKFDQYMLV